MGTAQAFDEVAWDDVVRSAPAPSTNASHAVASTSFTSTDEEWQDDGLDLVDGLVFIDRPPPLDEVLAVLGTAAPRNDALAAKPADALSASPSDGVGGVVVTGVFASFLDDHIDPAPAAGAFASPGDELHLRTVFDEVERLQLGSEVLCSLRRGPVVYDATVFPPGMRLGASAAGLKGTTWTAAEADAVWSTVSELADAGWNELSRRDCVNDSMVEAWVSIEDADGLVTRQCRIEVPLESPVERVRWVEAHHEAIAAQAGGAWASLVR